MVIPSSVLTPARLPWLSGLVLVLLCWLAFFHGLGSLGLMDKTEALFVEVAHQMHVRGDWITPWWNGERFFDYPVWGYWLVALSFRLFGVSEWAARLPVALAASAVVVGAFLLLLHWPLAAEPPLRRHGRALLGAAVLATSPGWIGWGRTSTTDMFLSSAISLALFGFLLTLRHPRHARLAPIGRMALAGFSAVAVLAKGPVGLLLPALVIVVFLTLTHQWGSWLAPWPLVAMALLFAGVCLPWYAAAARVNGMAFLAGFLGFSNLQRFTSVIYDHPGPPWFYLPWLIVLLLPWSLFLPAAIGATRFWRLERWRRAGAGDEERAIAQLPLLLLLWLALMVAFFSAAATKLPGYILPALPAGALLVALWWQPLAATGSAAETDRRSWSLLASGWLNAALLGVLAAAAALAPRWAASDPAHPAFAIALERSGLPLRLALLLAGTSLALVLLLLHPHRQRWLWMPDLAGFLAVLALVVAPLGAVLDRERQLPLRELAVMARQQALAGEPLWVVGTKRYSTLFYGGETAAFVDGRKRIQKRWREDPAALGITARTRSVRLLGDRRHLEELEFPAARIQRLGQRGEQELWRLSLGGLGP